MNAEVQTMLRDAIARIERERAVLDEQMSAIGRARVLAECGGTPGEIHAILRLAGLALATFTQKGGEGLRS